MDKTPRFVGRVDTMALPAPIREAFLGLIRAIWDHGVLDPQLREMIRVRSAILADCRQ
jgi:hypothetical protein